MRPDENGRGDAAVAEQLAGVVDQRQRRVAIGIAKDVAVVFDLEAQAEIDCLQGLSRYPLHHEQYAQRSQRMPLVGVCHPRIEGGEPAARRVAAPALNPWSTKMQALEDVETAQAQPAPAEDGARKREVSISYLRAFVTFLVVAHHVALVYSTIKPPAMKAFTDEPRFWLVFPVADPASWVGFSIFMGWNDIFFMPLMFFVSGVLVWQSLVRKGAGGLLRSSSSVTRSNMR